MSVEPIALPALEACFNRSQSCSELWAFLLVENCVRHGVREFVIAPGSRSTPLTLAAVSHPQTQTYVHVDERGLGFYALGLAKASHDPVVVITTSGTAVANLLPAVIEAYYSRVPLILLTADRPPELQDCGANQTIHQPGLFGVYTRHFASLPVPSLEASLETLLSEVSQAVCLSKGSVFGPVHLNCPFREPLWDPESKTDYTVHLEGVASWVQSERPYEEVLIPSETSLFELDIQDESVCIVAGELKTLEESQFVLDLSQRYQWTILPDVQSHLGLLCHEFCLGDYHQRLLIGSGMPSPTMIIHVGGRLVSKQLEQWLATFQGRYIHIDPYQSGYNPMHLSKEVIHCSVLDFNQVVQLRGRSRVLSINPVREKHKEALFSEASVIRRFIDDMAEEDVLFCGNSKPIRIVDQLYGCRQTPLRIVANRGASGIDGVIASAIGFVQNSGQKGWLFIGDLSFIHDMNSLLLLKQLAVPLTIVVLNDNGGRIFETLPIGAHDRYIEPYFVAPHHLTFEAVSATFQLPYHRMTSLDERLPIVGKGPQLIEVCL